MQKLTEKLFTVKYKEDTGKPHIEIIDQAVCANDCKGKYCTHFCPAGVYEWSEEQKKTLVSELATKMGDHARRFGLEVREFEPVKEIDKDGSAKVVRMESGDEFRAPALIMAAGGLPRYLGVTGEKEYWGRGVSYCAVCDGAFFKGEELAVVGGGDAAVEEGEFLTRYASKVYILHRRSQLRAQPILIDRAEANPKIEFIFDAGVKEIVGNGKVQSLKYEQHGATKQLSVGGVFIYIGFVLNSGLFKLHVKHEEGG